MKVQTVPGHCKSFVVAQVLRGQGSAGMSTERGLHSCSCEDIADTLGSGMADQGIVASQGQHQATVVRGGCLWHRETSRGRCKGCFA